MTSSSDTSPREWRLISWNVNGLRAVLKKDFFTSVNRLNPDILLLQETKLQKDQRTPEMIDFSPYESFWAYASVKKGYSGVAAFSKKTPHQVITRFGRPEYDGEGRVIRMDFDRFTLFNVYFPNGQMSDERLQYKLDFYDWLLTYTQTLRDAGKGVIITGDFNTAHNEIDLKNPGPNSNRSGFLRIERDVLDRMIDAGYVDTFRHFYPEKVKYSWWSYRFNARKNNAGWRIDYFFVTQDLLDNGVVKDAFIDNDIFGSDHCPVGLIITV
ncbi:exodeoxyribonuclease III [Desulfotignum phosphitoxidans]|uniref:Exodeoxyribonuclease III n=1 Tax=Desulfotignum phosphitoxidans DSM 13687 TaxID=1286635 RepID=S0FRB5_9BACT|nr:exodeoxyribonuclease III [Desulfotignum phosphitoxidans]EMS77215.1 exodeoxyribonuclease III [Desulfotignum phosphitoxidans DSM 13687]